MDRFGLAHNPFPPAATGVALTTEFWIPPRWEKGLVSLFDGLSQGRGVKAAAVQGEYGSGKTYLLQWLGSRIFEPRRIRPFYFDNPGLEFYELANRLLRQLGRYELAKSVWQMIPDDRLSAPRGMFGFPDWLAYLKTQRQEGAATASIRSYFLESALTDDEEIATRLARMIVETGERPYFEYRDFVAGRKGAVVAEREEAPYFTTLIRLIIRTQSVDGVAFLIDEFEEVALQRRLTRRQSFDYLATLRRLINVSAAENLWIVVSMTPEAVARSEELDPALWERFTASGKYLYRIPPLDASEARELILRRLQSARTDKTDTSLRPFPDDLTEILAQSTVQSPRRIIKFCFAASSDPEAQQLPVPLPPDYIRRVERQLLDIQPE